MAITATFLDSFVMGNKRCELWSVVGSSDTGGTFTAGVIPDVCFLAGKTTTPPVAPTIKSNPATSVVTVGYTSGSPDCLVLVIGH